MKTKVMRLGISAAAIVTLIEALGAGAKW